ncbi:synaptic vesicle transporter [Xylogone sp. PMI_703]|nr:synaptic vesicle transporter [Xylogone sp. PMI_703]
MSQAVKLPKTKEIFVAGSIVVYNGDYRAESLLLIKGCASYRYSGMEKLIHELPQGLQTDEEQLSSEVEVGQLKLDQSNTCQLQQRGAVGSIPGKPLPSEKCPPMGAGKPFPPQLADPEAYIVEFDSPDDPKHPQNWKPFNKFLVAFFACYGTLTASFASAVFAAGIPGASKEFHISTEVGALGTTLYVLGFAAGPILWAPMSELIGRRWPLTIGMLGSGIFCISSAVSKDVQTLIICRFFAGTFGASQLSVVPGLLADIYNNKQRGIAISIYSISVFGGPFCAPFIGGFAAISSLGWRWTLYISAFMTFLGTGLDLIFVKETYAPSLLVQKAAEIRCQTHNWGVHARMEEAEVSFGELMEKYFTRPLRMLVTEPIVLLVSLYMAFIYGLVYALLEAYPYVFEDIYGMSPGVGGLTFLGLLIGQLFALAFILSQHTIYARKLHANNNVPVPEWRLPPVGVGAVVFTVGLFWFGWTGFRPSIHWMAPTAAGVLLGFGILCIFLPCFNYLLDSYLHLAASVVAANIIFRSAVAAAFPLFTRQMFQSLGVQWACTLLGCLAAIMIPIPFAFQRYGLWIRSKSPLAYCPS